MKQLETGTKPTRTYTSEEVATIINGAMRLDKQNKALAEELEDARERLGQGDELRVYINEYSRPTIKELNKKNEDINIELVIFRIKNKALAEELEQARENLGKGDKYRKALEEIASGRCMAHFEYCDIAREALK